MEEDGAIVDQVCKSALPLMVEGYESVWCSKTCQICYKMIDEPCEDEELIDVSVF